MIRHILTFPFFVVWYLILTVVDFVGHITGVHKLHDTEADWIRENGEIPDGHYLDCGWKVGATGTIEEYRCELRRVGSSRTDDLPFSY